MQLEIIFDQLEQVAREDAAFRNAVLDAYEKHVPLREFCSICRDAGIEVYPMDIVDADETAYAAMRRSTNGGGENSPHLQWEGEIFQDVMKTLRELKEA